MWISCHRLGIGRLRLVQRNVMHRRSMIAIKIWSNDHGTG
jgi:hypothetical protein